MPGYFASITTDEKREAADKLIDQSAPNTDFFIMILLSILMAAFGLLIDSAAVIIGSMLIAPMLYPILSLSMGVVVSDAKLMKRSLVTLLKAVALSVLAAAGIALFAGYGMEELTDEILARTGPSLLDSAIAVVAGMAASFAMVRRHLNEALPGVAVSVALVPPLAVTGIGLARFEWSVIASSFVLFLVNLIGVVFASLAVFAVMNFQSRRKQIRQALRQEQRELNDAMAP